MQVDHHLSSRMRVQATTQLNDQRIFALVTTLPLRVPVPHSPHRWHTTHRHVGPDVIANSGIQILEIT
jgi:hypothetical protein